MKHESEPVTADEWLIRRVHRDLFRVEKTPYISPKAFLPRTKGDDADVDGISLFRLECLASADDILTMIEDLEKRKAIGFVQLLVSEFTTLGLTVHATKIDALPGHVSIAELNVDAIFDRTKRSIANGQMDKLAEIASQPNRILRDPKAMFGG